jgi:peptidoglycan/LPS O-acetylase OafA/YrhL
LEPAEADTKMAERGSLFMTSTAVEVAIGPTFGSLSHPRVLSKTDFYVPEIDGLRAIAVGTVMTYHLNFTASLLPGGFVGVDIFFVISGYVVSASLGRDAGRSLLDLLQRFYSRRILRIVPALLACLLATIAASILFIPNAWLSDTNYKTALYAFFGMSNFVLLGADSYFSPRPEFNPFTHTWSLAVEEQFYLFFPLIFFVWNRFKDGTGVVGLAATGLLTGLSIVSFIFMWWMGGVNQDAAFYLLPSRFWELGIGAILFQVQCSGKSPIASATHARRALTSGAVLVLAAALFADRLAFPFPWAVPAAVGALLIIAAVSTERASPSPVARVLRSRPMIFVGKISYSLYLWHWPVYTLMRWTVGLESLSTIIMAVGLSLVFAYLSYTVLERPIRRAGWIIVQPKSLVVAGGLAAMVLSWETARVAIGKQYRLSMSVVMRDSAKWYPYVAGIVGCFPEFASETIEGTFVNVMRPGLGPDCSRRHLFVVGDSHAGAYTAMLSLLAAQDGVDVRLYQRPGCSFANLLRPTAPDCVSFVRSSANDVVRRGAPGDVVFLAALRMNRLSDDSGSFIATHAADLPAHSDADRRLAYEEAAELIDEFSKKGLRVIIEAPKPVFKAHTFRCSDWFNAGNPACRGGLTIAREELLEYRKPVMNSLAALSSVYPQLVGPVPDTLPAGPLPSSHRDWSVVF